MQGCFPEQSTEVRPGSGIQEPQSDVFRSQAGGAYQRRVGPGVPLEIEIGPGVDERVDQGQLPATLESALEQHVGDVVQRMSPVAIVGAPAHERVGSR